MNKRVFLKAVLKVVVLLIFSGLNFNLSAKVNKIKSDSNIVQNLTTILNHLIKKEFTSNDLTSITMNTTTTIYTLNRGLTDSSGFNLSQLNLDDPRIQFSDRIPDSSFSIEIIGINHFASSQKYEIKLEQRAGSMGGHSVSYVYKRRKGVFKRWVYKRYPGSIWCGYW